MRTVTNYVFPHHNIADSHDIRKSPRMSGTRPSLETREEVMFFDTDCGGVVHNLAYLRMIETCRTRLAALMGMDLRKMSETHVFPVVTRTEIDYKRPARLGDWLTIRGRLDELSRARFWCAFEMIRESDGTTLVTARQALALVAMPEGKPMRLPAEWSRMWG
jgi:YbgC/YbaW family acyl-CoA thioester hydrolase